MRADTGTLVGVSQTASTATDGEDWSCSFFFPAATAVGHTCVGFVWRDGRMEALPTLGGPNGFATGVNDAGGIVGTSCPASGNCLAVRWAGGRAYDLQDEIVDGTGSGYDLLSADDVNDAGVITGQALDVATGAAVTFVATPTG